MNDLRQLPFFTKDGVSPDLDLTPCLNLLDASSIFKRPIDLQPPNAVGAISLRSGVRLTLRQPLSLVLFTGVAPAGINVASFHKAAVSLSKIDKEAKARSPFARWAMSLSSERILAANITIDNLPAADATPPDALFDDVILCRTPEGLDCARLLQKIDDFLSRSLGDRDARALPANQRHAAALALFAVSDTFAAPSYYRDVVVKFKKSFRQPNGKIMPQRHVELCGMMERGAVDLPQQSFVRKKHEEEYRWSSFSHQTQRNRIVMAGARAVLRRMGGLD